MPGQIPSFSEKSIADLTKELYGFEGEISPLNSFEDQNARIKTADGSYVLKISNKRWENDALQMQMEALEHLEAVAPDISLPRVVPTRSGETITMVDGFAVRLVTYIEGELFSTAVMSPELYRDLGRYMGRFTRAMQGFTHPAAFRPDDIWNLDNVMASQVYLHDIDDQGVRARVERFICRYETNVQPRLENLRKSVLHHDANDQNLLVSIDDSTKIAGLIDFGDMELGTLVNELAITLAYALFEEDDIVAVAREVVQGYTQEFPLETGELDVLIDLVGMRLVQGLLVTSNRAKQNPENAYILSSQKSARALLEKLEAEPVSII